MRVDLLLTEVEHISNAVMNPPGVSQYVSVGFKAGVPARRLLDLACAIYGTAWVKDPTIQREIIMNSLDETLFSYGHREQLFLRMLIDELDQSPGSEMVEELALAACVRASAPREMLPYLLVHVGSSRLRVSTAFSNLGSKHLIEWPLILATPEALRLLMMEFDSDVNMNLLGLHC